MLPHDLVGDAREELEVAGRHLHVGPRLAQRLAVVPALEGRQLLGAVPKRLRHAQHDPAALGGHHPAPRLRLERGLRGRHRAIDVRLRGLRDRRQIVARRRIEDLEGLAVGRLAPLAVQNQLFSACILTETVVATQVDPRMSVLISVLESRGPSRRSSIDRSARRSGSARSTRARRRSPARARPRSPRRTRVTPRLSASAGQSMSPARRRPRPRRLACCLISMRLSDAS